MCSHGCAIHMCLCVPDRLCVSECVSLLDETVSIKYLSLQIKLQLGFVNPGWFVRVFVYVCACTFCVVVPPSTNNIRTSIWQIHMKK